jgi:glycosyltransferase involved in cell wall biosynthesis
MLNIGIDASRCHSGGGYAHMIGILTNIDPKEFNIDTIHIWSHAKLLDGLPDFPWLIKHSPDALKRNILWQLFWQAFSLNKEMRISKCEILLTADGSSLNYFHPQVVLSRDMLSYEPGEMERYGWGIQRLRLLAILGLQNMSFRRADGVIFLTKYASEVIQNSCGPLTRVAIIPHGVGREFKDNQRRTSWPSGKQRSINCLYISNAMLYKHQWHVVAAVESLIKEGIDIEIALVGGGAGKAQEMLDRQIIKSDPNKKFVKLKEFVPQGELPGYLAEADMFVFASSCENMPNTLVEAMAAGLPIACSNRGPMPEVLGQGGVYFNPEDPNSIKQSILKIVNDPLLRKKIASISKELSQQYSWKRCSHETFSYLAFINKENNKDRRTQS